MMLSFL